MEHELAVFSSTGSQVGTSSRWGDYTSMQIDNDGCTFWYTNQYYQVTAVKNWSTQLSSVRFAGCGPNGQPIWPFSRSSSRDCRILQFLVSPARQVLSLQSRVPKKRCSADLPS